MPPKMEGIQKPWGCSDLTKWTVIHLKNGRIRKPRGLLYLTKWTVIHFEGWKELRSLQAFQISRTKINTFFRRMDGMWQNLEACLERRIGLQASWVTRGSPLIQDLLHLYCHCCCCIDGERGAGSASAQHTRISECTFHGLRSK